LCIQAGRPPHGPLVAPPGENDANVEKTRTVLQPAKYTRQKWPRSAISAHILTAFLNNVQDECRTTVVFVSAAFCKGSAALAQTGLPDITGFAGEPSLVDNADWGGNLRKSPVAHQKECVKPLSIAREEG
jgi:hypothetical protein